MRYAAAIEHFGPPADIARRLGISVQAVTQWESKGIVPYHSASRLHDLSAGALALEPEHYGPGGRILRAAIDSVRAAA